MGRSGRSRSSSLARAAARITAGALLAAVLVSGCNALLGLTDVPEPADGSTGVKDPVAPTMGDAPGASDTGGALDATSDAGVVVAPDAPADAALGDVAPEAAPAPCSQCLGGLCSTSACQPVALVGPNSGVSPWGLAQDDSFLYWTDYRNSVVERTNKVSGETDILTQQPYSPIPIAVDDAGLYWGDSLGLWSCPKAACLSPVLLAFAPPVPTSLAIDGVNVYWSQGNGVVLSEPKDGSTSATPLWAGDAATTNVATDGVRVYFTARDGLLRGVAVDGSAPFAIGLANPRGSYGVALDGVNVYWTEIDPTQGLINQASTASLVPMTVASGQHFPAAIATDGTHAYWLATTDDAGTVVDLKGCLLSSCIPTLLGSGYSSQVGIVVDSQAIYWTDTGSNSTNGAIWKLAK